MNLQNHITLCLTLCAFVGANAQSPTLMWEHQTNAPSFGSAAAADLDNDGLYEIVFTTYTNDGKARCLNAEDGSVKWIFDIGGCGDVAPIIYDLDQDGDLDVFVNGSCNPTCFAIDGNTGQQLWSVPSGGGDSPPTIADVDQDGLPEVLFFNFNGQLRVLNAEDGTTYKNIQVDPNGQTIQTEPTLVDVDQDGDLDVLGANFWNTSGLFEWAVDIASETILWSTSRTDPSDFHAYHSGALADVDNDGLLEYVIGSNDGTVRALNVEDGSQLWNISIPNSSMMSAISIADMDNDGILEVIFNNNDPITLDERIWMLSGDDGTVEWSYPIPFVSFRGASISDVNDNGILDLVSCHFMGDLTAIEPGTGLLWQYDLLQHMPSGLPWFDLDHQPLIADFDQNGTIDVFVVGGYGTYTPDAQNTGKAFMLEVGPGNCPEWLMFRQDLNRSGYLSDADIAASCATVGIQDQGSSLAHVSLFPVPASDHTTVQFADRFSGSLEVFNSQGALLFSQALSSVNSVDLPLSELNSGAYQILLSSGLELKTLRLVVE